EPPLVAARTVQVGRGVLVAGLGAAGRVGVTADLDLEQLHRRAVAGPEQVVEELGALRLRIVEEQPAVAAAPADRTDAVERAAGRGAVDGDRGRRRGGGGGEGDDGGGRQ